MRNSFFIIGFSLMTIGVIGFVIFYPNYLAYSTLVINPALRGTYSAIYYQTMALVIGSVIGLLSGLAFVIYAIIGKQYVNDVSTANQLDQKYCSQCGKANPIEANFCKSCGADLSKNTKKDLN